MPILRATHGVRLMHTRTHIPGDPAKMQ